MEQRGETEMAGHRWWRAGDGEQPAIEELHVADAMHEGVLACPRDTPLDAVARLMVRERVHCIVVADENGGTSGLPWGIVSDLDLVAAATVRPLDEQTAAGSAATPIVSVAPNETLERAAQLMTELATQHLVVVDPVSAQPVGVISTLDIAAALGGGPEAPAHESPAERGGHRRQPA
jgi:CBS domain-containing protein